MGRYESLDESMHGGEVGTVDDDDGNLDGERYKDGAEYNNEEDEGSPNHPEISQD